MGDLGGGLGGLLPFLAMGESSGSCSTSDGEGGAADCAAADILAFLSENVGRRVKLVIGLQTLILFTAPKEITARIVCVGTDFVVIDRICVNSTPMMDPLRLTLRVALIEGAQRLTPTDELIESLCIFG